MTGEFIGKSEIRDVAVHAKVSVSTFSRAIREPTKVREESHPPRMISPPFEIYTAEIFK